MVDIQVPRFSEAVRASLRLYNEARAPASGGEGHGGRAARLQAAEQAFEHLAAELSRLALEHNEPGSLSTNGQAWRVPSLDVPPGAAPAASDTVRSLCAPLAAAQSEHRVLHQEVMRKAAAPLIEPGQGASADRRAGDSSDSDDECDGPQRAAASLTWLEQTICRAIGASVPSEGGDDATLILVLTILTETSDPEAAASTLLAVLGDAHVDVAMRVVSARRAVLDALHAACGKVRRLDEAAAPQDSGLSMTVRVNTASQKAIAKMERKAAKKMSRNASAASARLSDLEFARTRGWAALQDTEIDRSNVIVLDGMEFTIGSAAGSKPRLPPGTKQLAYKGYDEVTVPAVDPGALLPPPDLVQIGALPAWAQTAFKGYKTLNRIQSAIFQDQL